MNITKTITQLKKSYKEYSETETEFIKEEDLKWAIKSAGKCKLIVAGGKKINESIFLKQAEKIIFCGASGMAVGRNLWGSKNPLILANTLNKIIFKK